MSKKPPKARPPKRPTRSAVLIRQKINSGGPLTVGGKSVTGNEEYVPKFAEIPKAPDVITDDEMELWEFICHNLLGVNFLYQVAIPQIVRYVKDQSLFLQLNDDIINQPTNIDDKGVVRPNPLYKAMHDAHRRCGDFEISYGLNPNAAARMPAIMEPISNPDDEGSKNETFGI